MGGADAFEASNEAPKTASSSSSSSVSIVGEADRVARAEKERQLLLHTCEQHGVQLEGAAGRAISQWLETAQTQNESLAKAFEARLAHVERGHGDQAKKIREMESQRVKLETDLKNRAHRHTSNWLSNDVPAFFYRLVLPLPLLATDEEQPLPIRHVASGNCVVFRLR